MDDGQILIESLSELERQKVKCCEDSKPMSRALLAHVLCFHIHSLRSVQGVLAHHQQVVNHLIYRRMKEINKVGI